MTKVNRKLEIDWDNCYYLDPNLSETIFYNHQESLKKLYSSTSELAIKNQRELWVPPSKYEKVMDYRPNSSSTGTNRKKRRMRKKKSKFAQKLHFATLKSTNDHDNENQRRRGKEWDSQFYVEKSLSSSSKLNPSMRRRRKGGSESFNQKKKDDHLHVFSPSRQWLERNQQHQSTKALKSSQNPPSPPLQSSSSSNIMESKKPESSTNGENEEEDQTLKENQKKDQPILRSSLPPSHAQTIRNITSKYLLSLPSEPFSSSETSVISSFITLLSERDLFSQQMILEVVSSIAQSKAMLNEYNGPFQHKFPPTTT